VASGFSGPMSYKLGRKSCIWIACALCAVSDVIMMATTSIGGLYAGRLLIGLANGMLMSFSQLYLQECTPAQFRGMALSAFQFWTSIGTLVMMRDLQYATRLQLTILADRDHCRQLHCAVGGSTVLSDPTGFDIYRSSYHWRAPLLYSGESTLARGRESLQSHGILLTYVLLGAREAGEG
jgi:MFS family permease